MPLFLSKRLVFLSVLILLVGFMSAARAQGSVPVDKFLKWIKVHRDEASGMPYSHVGDARFERWTITYDAAVVAMAYLASGEMDGARKILDGYINTPRLWRLGGVVEAFVAGEGVQVKDWSVRSGANIWLANAAIRCYQKTGQEKYLALARRIVDFILSLQDQDKNSPNFGGVSLGPAGDLSYPSDQHIAHLVGAPEFQSIYATEIAIDAYAVFSLLGQATGEEQYRRAAGACFHWLAHHALNRLEHRLNRGYQDPVVATDVHSWAISALGLKGLEKLEPGLAENMVDFVESNCLVTVVFDQSQGRQMSVQGVDFIDKKRAAELGRAPMVSFEWTFQWINAYARLEKDFSRKQDFVRAKEYSKKRQVLLSQLLKAASVNHGGLAYPYATQANAVIGHEYSTPDAGNFSVIGCAYAILALKKYDPLVIER